ncbi:MAG: response regulator transcription factor [Chloroflexi bacterium]|uniref:response regulator transcription factor n=1 Tax=Candidatus Flexifilum breve TaxID=3140694 RepID=UPI0031368837|nr:response regulator transcription factor [Chloroflexota bacterium]MBK9747097.1 response regulator transcription factor [Chloroflexota bacterium]
MPIRVMLVDDHAHIHKIVSTILEAATDITLVAQCSNGQEALLLCAEHQPDIILMDVIMPVMDGIEATQRVHQTFPHIKILVLSAFQDDDSVHAMLAGGAIGYILKTSLVTDLVHTIRTISAGNTVLSAEVARVLLGGVGLQADAGQDFKLTQRELEILRAMAEGLNNGEIAARFVISQSTVKFHIANLLDKMGVQTRSEAIVLAAKNNLV